jgi:prepilin peptidase CpaA
VLEFPLLAVFPLAMVFAGAMDLLTMTIPNRVSLALIAAFLVAAPLAGFSLEAIGMHLAAFALVLAVGIGLFSLNLVGGGDVKLLAVAALWIGFDLLMPYLFQVSILGGILSASVLAYRWRPAIPGCPEWATRLHQQGTGIPYGLAIAGAALWIYPQTPWFKILAA